MTYAAIPQLHTKSGHPGWEAALLPSKFAVLKVHGTLITVCFSRGGHCSALVSLKDKKCLKERLHFSLRELNFGSESIMRNTLAPSLRFCSRQCAQLYPCCAMTPAEQLEQVTATARSWTVATLAEYVVSTKYTFKGGRKKGKYTILCALALCGTWFVHFWTEHGKEIFLPYSRISMFLTHYEKDFSFNKLFCPASEIALSPKEGGVGAGIFCAFYWVSHM